MGDSPQDNGHRRPGSEWPWVAAVVLIAILAAWPAIGQPGLLNTRGGGDSPFLLQRLHQLTAALADGHFPVRWMPDANYGYGYPFYNFYAPLSIYVAAVFRFLGFSFVRAIHLAQLAGFIVAGLGMFHLGRRWLGSRWAGLLAAVAYTVAPFHMVNVYVRGDSLAEFWAMAFYPVVLLAADGVVTKAQGSRGAGEQGGKNAQLATRHAPPATRHSPLATRPIAFVALAYAALILSHNISALIFTPFLALYLGLRLLTGGRSATARSSETADHRPPTTDRSPSPLLPFSPAPLLCTLAALVLALALAAWFFIPALAEQGLAQLGPVTEGYFHYSNHFRAFDLIQRGLLFDYNPDGGVAFRLGLAQVLLAAVGTAALLIVRPQTTDHRPPTADRYPLVARHSLFVTLSALIAIFMITPLSRPLWDHLPLLSFAQFPWRFLSVASFFLALLTGGLARLTAQPAARAAVVGLASLVLLAAALLGLRVDHLILTDADVTAERLGQYEWFTGNIGTTVSAEYLTPASSPRPWTSTWLNAGDRDRLVALSGGLQSAELRERRATRQTWQIDTVAGAAVRFPTLYWPGWRATIDGQPAELRPLPSSGLMALTIPPGDHTVALELGRTPIRVAAEVVSLVAVVVSVLLFIVPRRGAGGRGSRGAGEQGREGEGERSSVGGLWSVSGGVLLIVVLAFVWRNDPRQLPPGDLTWDFAQMAYLHHDTAGVGFEDGSRLHEYGYSAEELAAGQTLTVTLSLSPGSAAAATLALLTPASARPTPDGVAAPPLIAATTQPLGGDAVVFALAVPPDAPPGLYVPRLVIDGARPLLPSGGTRGELFLRPVRVLAAGEQGSGGARETPAAELDVRPLAIVVRDADTLDGRFAWFIDQPLGGRYQVSWRLQNGDGLVLSQLDTQPGYGYQPTDGWSPDEPIRDWLALRLPEALSGPPPYSLVMLLYDTTTGATLLTRRLGVVTAAEGGITFHALEPNFTTPDNLTRLDVSFYEAGRNAIWLQGVAQATSADRLALTLYWQAPADLTTDFTRFVHLIDATGAVVAQIDGHAAGNSYPTGQWTAGEVVADGVTFDLAGLPPGEYRLATGFYRPDDGARLEAIAPDGPLPDGRALLPDSVTIP